jgi:cysteine desulfurase / selenocysteine lyase
MLLLPLVRTCILAWKQHTTRRSLVLAGARPEEVGTFLDQEGIAVRAGHHCAQTMVRRFGVTGTVRPSVAFYNTRAEIDALIAAIFKYKKAW